MWSLKCKYEFHKFIGEIMNLRKINNEAFQMLSQEIGMPQDSSQVSKEIENNSTHDELENNHNVINLVFDACYRQTTFKKAARMNSISITEASNILKKFNKNLKYILQDNRRFLNKNWKLEENTIERIKKF